MAIATMLVIGGGAQAGFPGAFIIVGPGAEVSVVPSGMSQPCEGTICAYEAVGAETTVDLYACGTLHEDPVLYRSCKDATMEMCGPVEDAYGPLHEMLPVSGHSLLVRGEVSSYQLGTPPPYPVHPFMVLLTIDGHALPLDPLCSEQGPDSARLDGELTAEGGANGTS